MIPLPSKPIINDLKNNRAVFQINALYPGYGVTIGNSLRRVLLSSLGGAAITKIKIKGASHEFATIPGLYEDILTVILNLKQVRFKMFTDEPQKVILKVKGEKDVLASDIKLSSQIELVTKSAHIATITSKSTELDMEIDIEKGVGYSPKEERVKEKLSIGEIAIDAIFTPVQMVSFKVENMRVGERTDFDRLFLEVETDGSISPQEAFFEASSILFSHFDLIANSVKTEKKNTSDSSVPEVKEKDDKKEEKMSEIEDVKVEDMKLSTRTVNALLNNNLKTASKIAKKTEENLLEMEGMGEKAVKEIKTRLKKFNFELKQ